MPDNRGPLTDEHKKAYKVIIDSGTALAEALKAACPPCPDRDNAIQMVRKTTLACLSVIALNRS